MKIKLPHLAFELTDRCNLNCRYCYNIWKLPGSDLQPFNSYKKATKSLAKIFAQAEVKNVTLTGGEPFMAERLLEVALFCRMEGKTVTIISNGTLGKESDYKTLLDMGVILFEMPIHSAQEAIHDHITQINGSWAKSIASLKTVVGLGGYAVAVIVVTKYNVAQLGETLEFINSLGLRRIMLNRYNIGGQGSADPASVSASHSELIAAYKIADKKAEELNLTISSNVCTPICLLNPSNYPHIAFGHCSADVSGKPVTMDINGDIRLCNHSPIVAGNIFKNNIDEILHSDYAQSWSTIVPEYCSGCNVWERCRGGCRAASEQCGLGLDSVDPILTSYI